MRPRPVGVRHWVMLAAFPPPPGYEELLEALDDPSHEEHEAMQEWLGRPFDPTVFSVADANRRLSRRLRLSNKR